MAVKVGDVALMLPTHDEEQPLVNLFHSLQRHVPVEAAPCNCYSVQGTVDLMTWIIHLNDWHLARRVPTDPPVEPHMWADRGYELPDFTIYGWLGKLRNEHGWDLR